MTPSRGEIWLTSFDPTRGREQGGLRPALIVSAERFNRSPAALTVAVPLTSVSKGIRFHVSVQPPEGGLRLTSYIKCEDVRSISVDRLVECWGTVSQQTMRTVEDRLRVLMDL